MFVWLWKRTWLHHKQGCRGLTLSVYFKLQHGYNDLWRIQCAFVCMCVCVRMLLLSARSACWVWMYWTWRAQLGLRGSDRLTRICSKEATLLTAGCWSLAQSPHTHPCDVWPVMLFQIRFFSFYCLFLYNTTILQLWFLWKHNEHKIFNAFSSSISLNPSISAFQACKKKFGSIKEIKRKKKSSNKWL